MDYAGKIWVAICGRFILIVGVLSVNGGLVWTDKIEQMEQAKTRVIDMNAQPEQGVNKRIIDQLLCLSPITGQAVYVYST